jgi:serine protease AprX
MAVRRVTALTTTDEDLAAISGVASNAIVAGHVVVCDLEESAIAGLEESGVFIQAVESHALPAEGALAPPETPVIASISPELAAPSSGALEALELPQAPEDTDVYLLSLPGPMLPAWRDELVRAGAEMLERLDQGNLTARIAIADVPAVRALTFVADLRLFSARDTVSETQLAAHVAPPSAGAELVTFDAYLHPGAAPDAVVAWLAERHVTLAGAGRRKVRFFALRGDAVLVEMGRRPEVAAIEEFIPPSFANDRARALLGIDGDGAAAGGLAETGHGQVVAVADSGLDTAHADFAGRMRAIHALGRPPDDASDPVGHGTHVAGSVLGDGSASNGAIRGAAPEAELVFQSILDPTGGLGGLGLDLADLFDQAYADGARIHNNSWGALARGAYRVNSLEVDSYVWEHPDMLIVIAAGNNGTAANPVTAQPGFVDLVSVNAPGTAKNALTVGASRSDRTGIAGDPSFGAWWPKAFPADPIANQKLSGDPEAVAGFSGRGPCDEQIRIKPDLVAPGTFILSTRSSIAPRDEFWAENPANAAYAYMGGTSMAAPLVSGCAALVRQFYCDTRDHAPSAALLKATLINGTRWLGGPDAVADHPTPPNYHQGFGCVAMPTTLPRAGGGFELAFRDADVLAETGASRQYVVNVGAGQELRLCLAWTDPPGRGLQNTVTLIVERTNPRERWLGNPHRPAGVMVWDSGNNVQIVRLAADEAAAAAYRVTVVAANMLFGPQPFALVATGALESDLAPI